MSKKQWGHGYREGERDTKNEIYCILHDKNFEESRLIDRLSSQIILMAEYQVGEQGHDDVMYLACINCLQILNLLKAHHNKAMNADPNERGKKLEV